MTKWKVYLHDKCIDTVYYIRSLTADEVKKALIDSYDFDIDIVVYKAI